MIEERYNFNTSDTNYLETKRPGASVVNQATSEMDRKYAAHFDRMKMMLLLWQISVHVTFKSLVS